MFCKSCGAQMNDSQAVCLNCGCAAGTPGPFCANCGAQIDPNAAVCMQCGVATNFGAGNANGAMGGKDAWVPAGKDKTTALLLCFFLGSLGIHNFYLGETKKAIFKLAFFLGSCLLCLAIIGVLGFFVPVIFKWIDFFKMIGGSYTVDPDKVV